MKEKLREQFRARIEERESEHRAHMARMSKSRPRYRTPQACKRTMRPNTSTARPNPPPPAAECGPLLQKYRDTMTEACEKASKRDWSVGKLMQQFIDSGWTPETSSLTREPTSPASDVDSDTSPNAAA